MTSFVSKFALVALSFGAVTFVPETANAAIINYNFTVNIESGSLIGNNYTGGFSYDDSETPVDFFDINTRSLVSFFFSFNGSDFTELDDLFATVDFDPFDNTFLGLSYQGDDFTFASGVFGVDEAVFTYTGTGFNDGTGSITFTQVSDDLVSTPETSVLLGLLTVGGGILGKKKRKK
jgi:hypothetical protein